MWLLSALNQDQRQIVASYFNPIKLSENAPAPKGLKDLSKKDPPAAEGQVGVENLIKAIRTGKPLWSRRWEGIMGSGAGRVAWMQTTCVCLTPRSPGRSLVG